MILPTWHSVRQQQAYPNTYFIIISVVVSQCVLKYAYAYVCVCVCVCVKGHKKFWAFCSSILISICFGLRSRCFPSSRLLFKLFFLFIFPTSPFISDI